MALFTYMTAHEKAGLTKVDDFDVKALFEEAFSYDKTLFIKEKVYFTRASVFKRKKGIVIYDIYHICSNGESSEMRLQASASGAKEKAMAYLYGIINGHLRCMRIKSK